MNEERGTRDDQRAQADPSSGLGTPDGHQARPALGHDGSAPGTAGARGPGGTGGTDGADGAAAAGQRPAKKRSKSRSWWIELPILLVFALVLALII